MNRVKIIFYLLVFTISSKGYSQLDKYKGETFLFQDARTKQAIVIEHDSVYYKNTPHKFQKLKHTDYPEILSRYNAFNINGKNYFAHNGCGPILEWRNDSIIRIDNSFLHQNQYGATTFVYRDEIYYFGGYGLFTFKNVITKYIFKSKEWMAVQTFGNEFPSLRRDANRILIGDDLYIFSGLCENPADFYYGQIPTDNIVWKLDLKTMQWSKEGIYDPKYNSIENYFNFQNGSKMYMIGRGANNKLIEIDILNNTIKKYQLPSLILPKFFYFDEKANELVLLHFLSTKGTSKIIRLKLNSLLTNPIQTETFISNPYEKWLYSFVGLVVLSVISILFYKSKIKNTIQQHKSILFDHKSQKLQFKGKTLDSFDSNELKIITYLIKNQADYIPLNSLNNLFEQDDLTENYSSTTKRREITLNAIITKLSFITGINESDIILYRKNPDDKRMKEIKLKENLIQTK